LLAPSVDFQRQVFRSVSAAIALLLCMWLTASAVRIGISRLLADYGVRVSQQLPTDQATRFSPFDPESHFARATVLTSTGAFAEATKEYERAVALRPRDYLLWLNLGHARDQVSDAEGALTAFAEAARLAPNYAQPHWQMGNLLIRSRRPDEAFPELRRAAASNPTLFPHIIDLAFGIYNGDARLIEQAIQPQTSATRLALARTFAQYGKADEALRLFRAVGECSDQERRALLTALLANKKFPEAYEVWASSLRGSAAKSGAQGAGLADGSFETEISDEEVGFGWQIARDLRKLNVSLDPRDPFAGARSLLISWTGDSQPSTVVVSQLALVAPKTHYRLTFGARTEKLVTGGSPIVAVIDATSDSSLLSQSVPLSLGTNGWQTYSMAFVTAESTRAVRIAILRSNCSLTPCPVFGKTWFDAFAISEQ
jgi:hypothetical protein